MSKKLRRYKFTGLPQLKRDQVRAINALMVHLPQTPFEGGFKERVREVFQPLLHADIDVWFDAITPVEGTDLKKLVSSPGCVAVVSLVPRGMRALLEFDLGVAQQCIDRILGGTAEDVDTQRPLSEIEQGVFSFVILRFLQLVGERFGSERQMGLKLESIVGNHDELFEIVPTEGKFLSLSFKLFFDKKVGYARLILPQELVTQEFPKTAPSAGPARDRALRRMAARIDLVSALQAPLSVEVGRLSLAMSELHSLESDDIILLEQSDVRMNGNEVGGNVRCRIGGGERGILTGSVLVGESGRYEVSIDSIAPVGEPRARGHLFREESEMKSEHAQRLSASYVDEVALAAALERAVVARGAGSTLDPLAVQAALLEDSGAEHSDSNDDDDGGEEEDEPPSPEAAGLLEDITVAMVVELGRVMVSASDVIGLRTGQVIELSRAPGDAVDLVVDGKRIGKGELVEIDGELGVRILSLAK
jgi:flagellar motor switch protein FliM